MTNKVESWFELVASKELVPRIDMTEQVVVPIIDEPEWTILPIYC